MQEVGAPPTLRADEASLRRFREHAVSIKAFPALFTAGRNGTNCNPGEAFFLLYLLISNDGALYEKNLDTVRCSAFLAFERGILMRAQSLSIKVPALFFIVLVFLSRLSHNSPLVAHKTSFACPIKRPRLPALKRFTSTAMT